MVTDKELLKKYVDKKNKEIEMLIEEIDNKELPRIIKFARKSNVSQDPYNKFSHLRTVVCIMDEYKGKFCVRNLNNLSILHRHELETDKEFHTVLTHQVTKNMFNMYFSSDKTASNMVRAIVNDAINKKFYPEEYKEYLRKKESKQKYE